MVNAWVGETPRARSIVRRGRDSLMMVGDCSVLD
jgi:hypothetical protein